MTEDLLNRLVNSFYLIRQVSSKIFVFDANPPQLKKKEISDGEVELPNRHDRHDEGLLVPPPYAFTHSSLSLLHEVSPLKVRLSLSFTILFHIIWCSFIESMMEPSIVAIYSSYGYAQLLLSCIPFMDLNVENDPAIVTGCIAIFFDNKINFHKSLALIDSELSTLSNPGETVIEPLEVHNGIQLLLTVIPSSVQEAGEESEYSFIMSLDRLSNFAEDLYLQALVPDPCSTFQYFTGS
ncbi:hypothetical protein VNO77_27367 [Canavalia gladiata]|uniref:Uncharacterized protein n=1 Tax=Canavalia gladiata TaxID=3824 RepID=A0AAN9Q443_CANGL